MDIAERTPFDLVQRSAASPTRILALDGLRGTAALIVVVYHYLAMLYPRWVPDYADTLVTLAHTPLALLWNGPFAVSIFFVLSGFVMAGAAQRRPRALKLNVVIRFLRLALPVSASVFLAYGLLSLFPTAASDLAALPQMTSPWLGYVVQMPLPGIEWAIYDGFLGNFLSGGSAYNNVLWTMQIELVGSIALFLVYWIGWHQSALRFVALAAFAVVALYFRQDAYLCFVTGALLFEAVKAGFVARIAPWVWVPVLVTGVLLGAPGSGFADRWGLDFLPGRLQPGNNWGLVPVVAASLILLSLLLSPLLKRVFEVSLCQYLGRISFALYLVHVPILYTLVAWERLNIGLPEPVLLTVYMAIILAVAHVFARMVDEPTLDLLALLRRKADDPQALASTGIGGQVGDRGISTGPDNISRQRIWPWVIAGTIVLMLPALLNGVPFLYYDSSVYLQRPDGLLRLLPFVEIAPGPVPDLPVNEGVAPAPVLADEGPRVIYHGRSIYYGIIAWAGMAVGGGWLLVGLQAALVSLSATLAFTRMAGCTAGWALSLALGILAFVTPLGIFVGLAMPDILVGVLVLSIATLTLGWQALSVPERVVLFLIATFAIVSHTSHLVLGLVLTTMILVVAWKKTTVRAGAGLVYLGLAVSVGLLQLHLKVVDRDSDVAVLTPPHLVAHLIDDGPGVTYLREACPEAGFAMCGFVDKVPVEWRTFLFGGETEDSRFHVDAPAPAKIAISREQFAFTAAVLVHDPLDLLSFAIVASIRQLAMFDGASALIPVKDLDHFEGVFPDRLMERTRASLALTHEAPLLWLRTMTGVMTVASLFLLIAFVRQRIRHGGTTGDQEVLHLVVVLLAGLALNAVICGTLASPYDRFQARIIWLLPFSAFLVLALYFRGSGVNARFLPVPPTSSHEEGFPK